MFIVASNKDWVPGNRVAARCASIEAVELWLKKDALEYVGSYLPTYYVFQVEATPALVYKPEIVINGITFEEAENG